MVRPRWHPEPENNLLSRQACPELYALVDQVAGALGTKVDQIVVSELFTAGFAETGWKRKRTLTLGLPLWEILDDQERVAVLGHEIAHAVNGDTARGLFVGTAIQSLDSWFYMLLPPPNIIDENIIEILVRNLGKMAAGAVWLALRGMYIVAYRDSQRAEYLADRLGATVGGRDALIAALRKSVFDRTFWLTVQRCAMNIQNVDLYHDLRDRIARTPASELMRLHRLEQRDLTTLDTTHPPTIFRIRLIEAMPERVPCVTADPVRMRAIDAELAGFRKKMQTLLSDHYRASVMGV